MKIGWVRLVVVCVLAALGLGTGCGSEGGSNGPKPCSTDLGCSGSTPFCDPFVGCSECVLSAHCEEGMRCIDYQCQAPELCSADEECATTEAPVCSLILGECVGCVQDEDCGESAICERGTCRKVDECVNSRDCPENTVCNRELDYCVQCVTDGDCPEEAVCLKQACIPRCASDKDCKSDNLLCNHEAGYCVECVEHEDCPDVYHCSGGRCLVDECQAGRYSCLENNISLCSSVGDSSALLECPIGTTCQVILQENMDPETGEVQLVESADCTQWLCQPDSTGCTSGTALGTCASDGLSYTSTTDCAGAGGVCEDGACTDVACDAGLRFCSDNSIMQCSTTGGSFTPIQTCPEGQYCHPDFVVCQPWFCTPGTTICDMELASVMVCREDGSGHEVQTDCTEDDEVCQAGACVPKICEPNAIYCKDNNVVSCMERGAAEAVTTECTSTQFCDTELASCVADLCIPNEPICFGEVAGTCDSIGSGHTQDSAEDCSDEEDMACYAGECRPILCTTDRICDNGVSKPCLDNGTRLGTGSTCTNNQFCNPATGACQAQICTPSATGCSNNHISTCNSDGSGWIENTDCGASQACVSGTCLPVICAAGRYFCNANGNVVLCGPDGTTQGNEQLCAANQHCIDGRAACTSDVCTQGQPTCDGLLLTMCNEDGSAKEPGGTACPGGQICEVNACEDVICPAAQRYCVGNVLHTCNSFGTGDTSTTTCVASQFCNENATPQACVLDICAAGGPACDGETVATCDTDGGGFINQGTDCSASDMVCTGTGCAAQAVEIMGSGAAIAAATSYGYANRYYVTTPRTLTKIEQYGTVTGTTQVTWFVYESTSPTGTFTKAFESLNTSSGTDVFHSSGNISFDLEVGRYYLIGVRILGYATASYEWTSTATMTNVSFGHVQSGNYTSMSSSVPTTWNYSVQGYRFNQRLTTE